MSEEGFNPDEYVPMNQPHDFKVTGLKQFKRDDTMYEADEVLRAPRDHFSVTNLTVSLTFPRTL